MDAPESTSLPPARSARIFGKINYLLIVIGVLLLAVGYFFVLPLVDARAENSPATIAPLCLAAGYLIIFLGILIRPSWQDR